jgi:hypothetical protein
LKYRHVFFSTEQILEEFFDFYGSKFDYGNCAVNIRKGQRCTIISLEEELRETQRNIPRNDDIASEQSSENVVLSDADTDSVKTLKTVSREDGEQSSKMATEYGEDEPKETSIVWKTTPICVQDPFELTHNVTQNIGVSSLRSIIQSMMDACRICSTFASSGQLTNSDGIAALFRNSSKMSTKRKKKDGYTFSVYLCSKTDIDKVSSLQIPSVAMVCSSFSSSKELFDGFCKYLENELQIKCNLESDCEQDVGSKFSATCTALINTWTHCRRERRKIMKGKDDLVVASGDLIQESETKTQSREQSSLSTDEPSQAEGPPSHKHDDDKPILVFRLILHVNKDSLNKDSTECVVKLEHLDGPELQTFENFYAFFKKQVATLFT